MFILTKKRRKKKMKSLSEKRVVVVGAGLSGLAAALRLKSMSNVLSVRILEARDRVGGRVESAKFSKEASFDLGGAWLGSTHKRMLELAQRFGVGLGETICNLFSRLCLTVTFFWRQKKS